MTRQLRQTRKEAAPAGGDAAAAVISEVRKTLTAAKARGIFSLDQTSRLKKLLLKFRMTSDDSRRPPPGAFQDNHFGWWNETLFSYDDERAAPIIEGAAGDKEVGSVLREIARTRLEKGLPKNLAGYISTQLNDERATSRKGRPPANLDRDVCIFQAVETLRACGFNPTRNDATERDSGGSIVAAILKGLLIKPITEKHVEKIWRDMLHSIAPSVRK
jgi:hypothetical protein